MRRSNVHRSTRLLVALGGGLLLLLPGAASAAGAPRIIKPYDVTKNDLNPSRLYASPYLAVDPSNPKVIVGVTAELRSRRCSLVFSSDGGATWAQGQNPPAPNDYSNCVWSSFAAQSAMGRNGHAYLAITGWDDRDGGPRSGNMTMLVARTDDLGTTWRTTIVSQVRGKDGEAVEQHRPAALLVDAKSGSDDIVYVSFNRTQPVKVAPNAEPTRPMLAVSTDGGRTFGTPTDLSKGVWTDSVRKESFTSATTTTLAPTATTTTTSPPAAGSRAATPDQEANFGGSNARLTLDGDGNIYAAWRSATANVPNSLPVAPSTFVSVSKDHGKTWATSRVTNYTVGSASRIAWSKNGGPNGSLVMIFGRNLTPETSGNQDVLVQRSTDGGKTWSEPKNITDDDPKSLTLQTLPTLSAAPNGRLDAAWFDTRSDPGIRANDVYYAYSDDGGTTWSKNTRITDQPISRKFGVWQYNFDLTVPIGIASTNQTAVFGWDDTRMSDINQAAAFSEIGGGVQDVFAGAVQFEKLTSGGGAKAAKIVLAAALGLIAVAGILLVAALMARRSNGPAPSRPRKADAEAPAKIG